MRRLARSITPIPTECLNSTSGRDRESPDLVMRCTSRNFMDVGISDVANRTDTNSPMNNTEIIISDDDTPSDHSVATIVLGPNIMIDYEEKPAYEDTDSLSIANCSIPKIAERPVQENVGWIRCKPMKDLLSGEIIASSKLQVNNRTDDGIDLEKFKVTKNRKIVENGTNSLKRFDSAGSESSLSSSSSPIPPSPVSQRLRPRRRKLVSSDSESDTTGFNAVKELPHKNVKPEATLKCTSYHMFTKGWPMHEATPPTSGSDRSDDNSETKKKQHPIQKLSTPIKSSIEKKFTPKYIVDKNFKVIGTIKTDQLTEQIYNTRSTNVNIGNRIEQTSNSEKSLSHPSDDGNVMCVHNKVLARKLKNIIVGDRSDASSMKGGNRELIPRKLDRAILSSHTQKVNHYTQWMQRHPRIEEQISRKRDIPTGSSFCQWERVGMIWWLLKTNKIPAARLKRTWAEMQEDGYLKHRSMRSLQNHFLRKILPNLREFALPAEIVEEFKTIMH